MNKTYISIKKLSAVNLSAGNSKVENLEAFLTINSEFMRLGYIMSEDLANVVKTLSNDQAGKFFTDALTVLQKLKGADVKYRPMYRNFPKEVMDKSMFELYINAILHYWSFGTWMLETEDVPRELSFESSTFRTIGLCNEKAFKSIFTKLAASNASLSADDREILVWFMDNYDMLPYPTDIPFKETLCLIAADLFKKEKSLSLAAKTATDVLRIITHLSDGDISLDANTRFKSLSRKQRRAICVALEQVGSEEDFARHANKWVRAFHSLHVGDFKKLAPKTYKVATKLRNNKKIITFNSKVEKALLDKDVDTATVLLESRPGDFARRLDHVLRITPAKKHGAVLEAFSSSASKVATRVLMQLYSHFDAREDESATRVAFPKGSISKAVLLDNLAPIKNTSIYKAKAIIEDALVSRFSEQPKLGKVWIDPALANAPIPMQQRSASKGLVSVARGTRMPIKEGNNTLRFFIYWVGQDIDLSATLHDENFNMVEQISYTNLKSSTYQACHSGDITYAPNGAAEFIDITMDSAAKRARYVVMNVFVYSGPTFKEHKKVYAGWMTKSHPNRGDIFDPKLVEQKVDLTSETRNVVPLIFDLKTREAIWVDLATTRGAIGSTHYGGNNLHSNRASITDTLRAIVENKKPSLKKLFELHGFARGELVPEKEDADTVFSFDEGVTPFDIDDINSEYLA